MPVERETRTQRRFSEREYAAKKGDVLTLYTSIAEKDLPPLRETFEKKYGIKLTVLNALSRELVKLTVETALHAERSEHLGDEKYGDSQLAYGNTHHGTTPTRLKGQHGNVDILTPKDREGSVEPPWVRKNQTSLTFDPHGRPDPDAVCQRPVTPRHH